MRVLIIVVIFSLCVAEDDIWEQDLTSDMKIGISVTGYQSVDLKCGADGFLVNVTVDNDFDGVIYTRGSFLTKDSECFKTWGEKIEHAVLFSLKIPFDKCKTVEDASEEEFVNTLIIQHDAELIMPGDAAFRLSCAFKPEQTLGSTLLTRSRSKIVLVDADPAVEVTQNPKFLARSDSDRVTFPKDEL